MNRDRTIIQQRAVRAAPLAIYGTLLLLAACSIGCGLYQSGARTRWVLIVPLLACALVASRLRVFAALAPAVLFFTLAVAEWENASGHLASISTPVGMGGLLLMATALRFQSFVQPVFPRPAITSRIVHRPDYRPDACESLARPAASFRGGELISLLVLPLAWALSMFVVSRLAADLSTAESDYGLLPQSWLAAKLTLVLAVMFIISHGVLAYVRAATGGAALGSMRLRQEIWEWNGREQRLTAQARQRSARFRRG